MDINFISTKALRKRMKEDKSNVLISELRCLERKLIQYADDKEISYEKYYTDLELVKQICDFLKFKNIDHKYFIICDDLIELTVYWGDK